MLDDRYLQTPSSARVWNYWLVPVERWRPDETDVGTLAEHAGGHGGLARKP